MPAVSHRFFRTAVLFLIVGIGIGIHMSISQSFEVAPAHAHINLLGWVTSAIFGGYFALNPAKGATRLADILYYVHTIGTVLMGLSLYLLLKGNTALEPVVAVSSLIVLAGVLMFAWIVWQK